jgi:hypothetical protein
MEEFKRLLPQITRIEQLAGDGNIVCWEAYEESGRLIGYAFVKDIPETVPDIPGADEMDRYRVFGVVDPVEYKIINLDIVLHPDMNRDPWSLEVVESDFEKKFIGLTVSEIGLSPDGKIDAVSEATLSSTWITDAIREKVEEIVRKTKTKSG